MCAAILLVLVLIPLLLPARLVVALPGLPAAVRNSARMLLLTAVFLVVYEIVGDAGIGTRRPGRRGGADVCAALNRRMYGWGFAVAGLRLRPAPRPEVPADQPVIVLARHAGAFNSTLTIHLIRQHLGRDSLTVAKRCAAVTPGLRRVYTDSGVAFYDFDGAGRVAALRRLRTWAAEVTPHDALLLFPEGANYSARRWHAALAGLRAAGDDPAADRAAARRHVLPAQPVGAWTLARGAENADVLILGHTGLEDLTAGGGPRLGYPAKADGRVHVRWWHFPAETVPRGRAEFADWLDGRWREVDGWIERTRSDGRRGRTRPAPTAPPPPSGPESSRPARPAAVVPATSTIPSAPPPHGLPPTTPNAQTAVSPTTTSTPEREPHV